METSTTIVGEFGKQLLVKKIGVYTKEGLTGVQLMGYHVGFPLAKFTLFEKGLLIKGPVKEFKLNLDEVDGIKIVWYFGFDSVRAIQIFHHNESLPKSIMMYSPLTGRFYKNLKKCIAENAVGIKIVE